MALNYINLDHLTREYMKKEFQYDQEKNGFYLSNFLSENGKEQWPTLLGEAIEYDDSWLENEIIRRGLLAQFYPRRKPRSTEMMQAKVPVTAAQTLAEDEFNRLYARGLSARVISEGDEFVEVYRARYSEHPRPESEAIIGKKINPSAILQDLRDNPGVDTALGIPPGPNSGITIKKVE